MWQGSAGSIALADGCADWVAFPRGENFVDVVKRSDESLALGDRPVAQHAPNLCSRAGIESFEDAPPSVSEPDQHVFRILGFGAPVNVSPGAESTEDSADMRFVHIEATA